VHKSKPAIPEHKSKQEQMSDQEPTMSDVKSDSEPESKTDPELGLEIYLEEEPESV